MLVSSHPPEQQNAKPADDDKTCDVSRTTADGLMSWPNFSFFFFFYISGQINGKNHNERLLSEHVNIQRFNALYSYSFIWKMVAIKPEPQESPAIRAGRMVVLLMGFDPITCNKWKCLQKMSTASPQYRSWYQQNKSCRRRCPAEHMS